MFVPAVLIVALCVVGCREDEPLERLAPIDMHTFNTSPISRPTPPPPPPPPPPEPKPQPAPAPIAAFVRDRFGAPTVTLSFDGRTVELPEAQVRHFVARLAADDAFFDGMIGCSCGRIRVRIARGAEHVDFELDCGNVYVEDRFAGVLAEDLIAYIDAQL
jgi:hypothetical protein